MSNLKINNYPLKDKNWIDQETEKKYIVLHSTGSRTSLSPTGGKKESAKDVIDRWNRYTEKIANPYLIDRDGTITQCFPDEHWANHLRLPGKHGAYDKMSIGIDLVNENGLIKENSRYFINRCVHHQNEYRGPVFEKDFRTYQYWADLDPLQIDSLIALIKEISKKHGIKPIFVNSTEWDKKIWNKGTIFTHANVNNSVYDLPLNNWVIEKLSKEFNG
jgi:N-acetylmuramoyl-L-alanine amidase